MVANRVKCPFCPSLLAPEHYRAHFEALHRVDRVSGKVNDPDIVPKLWVPKARTKAKDEEEMLWED